MQLISVSARSSDRPVSPEISRLDSINSPTDVARLDEMQLEPLCAEIREFLIQSVSASGGHFAASLGVVELSVALARVYDSRHDRIIWDVGHQAYVHKILTGRREQMHSIRKSGGLSGFPTRSESEHDAFGTAHSSTSISAALGMACAARLTGSSRKHVAVIGDGALTAGLAYEGLCNAIETRANLLIIVNDNQMSISECVGAMPAMLHQLATERGIANSLISDTAEPHEATWFEQLGLGYSGPIDGHNVHALVQALRLLSRREGVNILHIRTQKGFGYEPARSDPITYHGPGPFDPEIGVIKPPTVKGDKPRPTYSAVFGQWLCEMAAQDERLVAVTPAMREGSGLVAFAREFPDRYFDVGIAEQHALTFAAGMACESIRPVVAIYSTFLQRAYDQLIHDIAIQNLPVLLAIDRAGLVGADGPTHAGSFDIVSLRAVPNLCVMTPADGRECRQMLSLGFQLGQPAAVRYPRGQVPADLETSANGELRFGKASVMRRGRRVAILAFGSMCAPALEVGEYLDATVVNMRFVKPIDEQVVEQMAASHDLLVSVEEGAVMGGAGSAVQEWLNRKSLDTPMMQLGLPDSFVPHGDYAKQLAGCGLDSQGISRAIVSRLAALRH